MDNKDNGWPPIALRAQGTKYFLRLKPPALPYNDRDILLVDGKVCWRCPRCRIFREQKDEVTRLKDGYVYYSCPQLSCVDYELVLIQEDQKEGEELELQAADSQGEDA